MNKNKETNKKDYNMNNRYKERHTSEDELDSKNERNGNKKRDGI